MTTSRFFVPFAVPRDSVGTIVELSTDVSHHALRVLRLRAGSAIRLFDGHGGEYHATIDRVDRQQASARIDRFDATDREWTGAPALVLATIASDALDVAIRKTVELGVSSVVPVVASRSQGARSGERAEKRIQHWRSIAIAACEQCGRNRLPSIAMPIPFAEWLRGAQVASGPVVIASPGAAQSLAAFATQTPPCAVVIGPEGGFTEAEMAQALASGLMPVHMGPRVLRADTAAIAAMATLAAIAGDAR